MRILFFLLSSDSGGVGSITRKMALYYKKKGYDVTLLCIKDQKKIIYTPDLIKNGININSLEYSDFSARSILTIYVKLFNYLKKNKKFDFIICPGITFGILIAPPAKILQSSAKTIVSAHTHFSSYIKNQSLLKKLFFSLGHIILPFVDRITNSSEKSANDLKEFYNLKKVDTIHNPASDNHLLEYNMPKSSAAHEWLKNDSLITLTSCGRLVETKNFSFMIDVFNDLLKTKNNMRLIIIGDGPQKDLLENQVENLNLSNYIHFTGFQKNPEKYIYHSSCFWLTSKLESFAVVLGEALSLGVPCIANDCLSGPQEVLVDGKYGLLIKNYDREDNAKTISSFLKKPPKDRSFYRQRGSDFHIDKIAKEYLKTLNKE